MPSIMLNLRRPRPRFPVLVLALLLLPALAACGKSNKLTVDVRDDTNKALPGVDIRQVGSEKLLATTGADGQAQITITLENGQASLRLGSSSPEASDLSFTNPYIIDKYMMKRGYALLRANHGGGGAAPDTTARLAVVTDPAGAEIVVDGQALGTSPDTVRVGLNPRNPIVTVEARLAGYHSQSAEIALAPGMVFDYAPKLVPETVTTASLQVDSTPAGARILLNGKATGKATPASLSGLEPGDYRVSLTKSGFETWQGPVHVEAGGTGMVSGDLVARAAAPSGGGGSPGGGSPGGHAARSDGGSPPPEPPAGPARAYQVSSAPYFAAISVDGKAIDNQYGPKVVRLTAGTHRFHLVNDRAGVNVVLTYRIPANDNDNKLVLDYQKREVRASNDPSLRLGG